MVSKELKNIIGIRAIDKTVVIILGLKNDPCCSGHTNKSSNSKQRDLGKFASPRNGLFSVTFEFGLFLRETIWFVRKSFGISCLPLLI